MTEKHAPWRLWGESFKQFRLRAGYASQTELADALSHLELTLGAVLVLSTSQISRWENGQRCPTRREQHLALIEGLARLGGIATPEEANAWLQAGNQGALSPDEIRFLFDRATLTLAEPRRQPSPLSPDALVWNGSAHQDWGDAPAQVPFRRGFHGRQPELAQLRRWVVSDDCRVVAILGMGGMGKTTLAAHLARAVVDRFDNVLWRSLLNAPPLDDILKTWLHFLSRYRLAYLPSSLDERLRLLLDYLREQRCLLVLDNCEAILESGARGGHYRPGYEEYGQLLRWLASQEHRSCLLLTSREKPHDLVRLERESFCARGFDLAGLTPTAGRALLQEQGVQAAVNLSEDLIARYSGNPLALKLVADTIQDLFGGDVTAFLSQETPLFDDIREVLDQQFGRLSTLERDLVIWLAVAREPLSLPDLERNLAQPVSRGEALAAVRALQRRSLLERVNGGNIGEPAESSAGSDAGLLGRFTLQNVVTEYIIDLLLAAVYQEVVHEQPDWLNRYALLKAQAKEYVRQSQERLLVAPLAGRLEASLGRVGLEARFRRILDRLRAEASLAPGYAAGNILNLLIQLGYGARGYDFSRLSVWQAYLRGKTVQEADFSHAELVGGAFTDTFSSVDRVAFSPDGTYLAATAGVEIRVWHPAFDQRGSRAPFGRGALHFADVERFADGWSALRSYLTCAGHTSSISCLCFSPDGRILASGSHDQTARLWDVETGRCLHILNHTGNVSSVCFSPDGHTLASGGGDHLVRLWDVETGACLHIFQGHTHTTWWIHFSPHGRTLASGCGDQTVRLWDGQTGEALHTLHGHTDWVESASFSPDGRTLASSGYDQTVRLWDVETGEALHILQGHTKWVRSVCFSPDGRILASGSDDQTIRLWDAQTGACLRILQGHTQPVRSVCFSPTLRGLPYTLVSGSEDQTVRLWDVQTGACLHILQGHQNSILSVCYNPAPTKLPRTLVSGHEDRSVRLWDVETGEVLHNFQGHTTWVGSICFSPDGRTVASGSDDQTARLWDVQTKQCLHVLEGHTARVSSVCFSPDGRTVASGSGDRTIRLWDVETGACLHILEGHTNWVWSVCFSPALKGFLRVVASGSGDRTIRLWDMETGACLHILEGHAQTIESVCFSSDGLTLASGSLDQTVRLWDVQTKETLHILQGHTHWVRSVCFSPAPRGFPRILASGSLDQTVRLWDVETGACLHILEGHTQLVNSVCFSSDSRTLVSGSSDQTMRLWDVETGACLRILRSDLPYERMNITRTTGLTAAQVTTLKALGAVTCP